MASKVFYIEVAPAVPLSATSRQTYTYQLATLESVPKGSIVTIPFGPRQVPGVVMSISSTKPRFPTKAARLKDTPAITAGQIQLAQTIAATMRGGLGYTLRLFFSPAGSSPSPAALTATYAPHPLSQDAKQITKSLSKNTVAVIDKDQATRHATLAQVAYGYAKRQQQVAIIVPEITMIEPVMAQLTKLIPAAACAAFYAGLGTKTTRQIWHQVKTGHIQIVVGTQKTLFLPWPKLKLIIIEQEHYLAHKLWDQYPRLPNRYLADISATAYKSHILYSTSFPSLWLRAAIQAKTVMPAVDNPIHPTLSLEASQFSDRRAKNLLPQSFVYRLKAWVKQDKIIFLLCNKRGAWQIAACRACHTASRCANCGATLLIQAKLGKLKGKAAYQLTCRNCQASQKIPEVCQACKQGKLQFIRPGIETIATALKALLPHKKIIRVDAGTVRGQSAAQITDQIAKAQIIIGTSAALTHLDGVQLDRIAWLFPEDTLLFPDVRSNERAWYTLARLAEHLPPKGAVVAVTRQEQLIKDVLAAGDDKFFAKEITIRQRLPYPPATDMMRLTFSAVTAAAATKLAASSRQKIAQAIPPNQPVIIRGPFASSQPGSGKDSHLLLFGDLSILQPLYATVPVSGVDYLPERIL